MFCGNCGSVIPDNVKFCPICGQVADGGEAESQGISQQPYAEQPYAGQIYGVNLNSLQGNEATKKKKGNTGLIVGCVVAAVVLLAVIVTAVVLVVNKGNSNKSSSRRSSRTEEEADDDSSDVGSISDVFSNDKDASDDSTGSLGILSGTAKMELNKIMDAIENYDIDTLVDESSDIYYDYYSDPEDTLEDVYEAQVGYIIDLFENKFGSSYKFSYTSELEELSTRQFEKLIDSLSGFETDWIESIAKADVTITASSNGKTKTQKITVYLSKESDGWKLLNLEIDYASTSSTTSDTTSASDTSESVEYAVVEVPKYQEILGDAGIILAINGYLTATLGNGQNGFISQWEEAVGIPIIINQYDSSTYEDSVGRLFASGDYPDVMLMTADMFEQYETTGILWDMSEACENAGFQSRTSFSANQKLYTDDGKLYGFVPSYGSGDYVWVIIDCGDDERNQAVFDAFIETMMDGGTVQELWYNNTQN